MKNFIKVTFCLLLILACSFEGIRSQDDINNSPGNLIHVKDSLIIDNQKINKLEKQIQQSLPQDLKPNVNIESINEQNDADSYGTERLIKTEFELTERAINRFIAGQNFPPISGTFPNTNITYTASISRPFITIRNNTFRAAFTIFVSTSEGYNYVIPLNPNLIIHTGNYSLTYIRAWLYYFPDLINSLNIPPMIKSMIIDRYNDLNLVLYPSLLLKTANNSIPNHIWLAISDFWFGYTLMDRKLKLTFSIEIESRPPDFEMQWLKRGPYKLSLRFYSSVETNLKYWRLYQVSGSTLNEGHTSILIPKDSYTGQMDVYENTAEKNYFVDAIFSSYFGYYVRQYRFCFCTTHYNNWFNPTLVNQLN